MDISSESKCKTPLKDQHLPYISISVDDQEPITVTDSLTLKFSSYVPQIEKHVWVRIDIYWKNIDGMGPVEFFKFLEDKAIEGRKLAAYTIEVDEKPKQIKR